MGRIRLRSGVLGWAGLAVALVAMALVVIVAVADGEGSRRPTVEAGGEYARAYAGLCTARSAARSGDMRSAQDAFFDRAHQPLHDLAARSAERDRAAAARLLEAKEAVEADLGQPSPQLASDLDRLLSATTAAIAATGAPRPEACPEGRT